jgi:hypothetical protein
MYNLDNKWVLQYSCSRICTIGSERGWGFYLGIQGNSLVINYQRFKKEFYEGCLGVDRRRG